MRKELFYLQLFFFLIHFYRICCSFCLKSHELFYELFFQVDKCVSLAISPLSLLILTLCLPNFCPLFRRTLFRNTGYTPSITKKLYRLTRGLSRHLPINIPLLLPFVIVFSYFFLLFSVFFSIYPQKNCLNLTKFHSF